MSHRRVSWFVGERASRYSRRLWKISRGWFGKWRRWRISVTRPVHCKFYVGLVRRIREQLKQVTFVYLFLKTVFRFRDGNRTLVCMFAFMLGLAVSMIRVLFARCVQFPTVIVLSLSYKLIQNAKCWLCASVLGPNVSWKLVYFWH